MRPRRHQRPRRSLLRRLRSAPSGAIGTWSAICLPWTPPVSCTTIGRPPPESRRRVAPMRGRTPRSRLAELVGDLAVRDPDFRHWWAEHDVYLREHGRKRYHHPVVGDLELGYEAMTRSANPISCSEPSPWSGVALLGGIGAAGALVRHRLERSRERHRSVDHSRNRSSRHKHIGARRFDSATTTSLAFNHPPASGRAFEPEAFGGPKGIRTLTSSMRTRRATNCAMGPSARTTYQPGAPGCTAVDEGRQGRGLHRDRRWSP